MIECPHCNMENVDDITECYRCFRKLNDDTPITENDIDIPQKSHYQTPYEREQQARHSSPSRMSFNFPTNFDDILGKALVEKYKSKCLNCSRRLAETDLICAGCGFDNRRGKMTSSSPKNQLSQNSPNKEIPNIAAWDFEFNFWNLRFL